MEEEDENPSESEINSFQVNKVLPTNIVDLNKKRKLQNEQLGLPLLKYKFGERRSGSEHESPFDEDTAITLVKGKTKEKYTDDGSEQPESAKDSNSSVGESGYAMSPHAEAKVKAEFPEGYKHDQPATSSGSCSSNSFKDTLYSLESRSNKRTSVREQESTSTFMGRKLNPLNLEGRFQVESGSQNLEEQPPGFGKGADYICSEYVNYEIEQCSDMGSKETMLYSNAVTSNLYVLSSGRWSVNQEARLAARKPTIDQEFEQYFSMLML